MPNGGLEYRSKEEWQKWEEPLLILDKNIKKFRKICGFKEKMRNYHNWPERLYHWRNKKRLNCYFCIRLAEDVKTYRITISASKRKVFYWFSQKQVLVDYLMPPISLDQLINYFKEAVETLDSWDIRDLEYVPLNKKNIILKMIVFIIWVILLSAWLMLVLHYKVKDI